MGWVCEEGRRGQWGCGRRGGASGVCVCVRREGGASGVWCEEGRRGQCRVCVRRGGGASGVFV